MNQDNRKNAYQEIDHIFKELLPAHGMAERPAQVDLSHRMLDAMLDGSIALCDAGTGIGKTTPTWWRERYSSAAGPLWACPFSPS